MRRAGFYRQRHGRELLGSILDIEAVIHLLFLCVTEITGCDLTFLSMKCMEKSHCLHCC